MLCNINGIHDRIMDNNIINFFQELPKPANMGFFKISL